jgi:hypothetical protein
MKISWLKRWGTRKLSPVDIAGHFSVMVYCGAGMLLSGTQLFSLGAIATAFISTVVAYTVAILCLTPRVDKSARMAEDRKAAIAQVRAARRAIMETYANGSLWWHHLIGAIGGSLFGALLAIVLAKFLFGGEFRWVVQ